MTSLLRRSLLAAGLLLAAGTSNAQAQWPSAKPVTLIVPFTASGSTDAIARLVAQKLAAQIGQSVVVENVAGGGGAIGTQRAANATPDGYTLLLAVDSPIAIAPYINPQAVRYDALRDFTPVSQLTTQPLLIVTRPGYPARTMDELIALAKASPGKLTYATSGIGSVLHLAMELIQQQAGISLTHVPYKGAAQAMTDIMGGQVDLGVLTSGSAVPMAASKRLQAIVVTDAKRLPALPDVQSISEVGPLRNLTLAAWTGIFVPARTPSPVVDRLNQELNKVLAMPEVVDKLRELATLPSGGPPQQFAKFVRDEQVRYEKIVRSANIKE